MLKFSTLQLLRIPFSFFLLPIFLFALSQINQVQTNYAISVFIILHLLVYPSSNGYNCYMDRDTCSIGLVKKPLQPTKQLFYVTIIMDVFALVWSLLISNYFTLLLLLYMAASHAYSYRGIRLKKYPFISFIIAVFFQGGIVYLMVFHSANKFQSFVFPVIPMIISSLIVASFYPLTQVYQHKQDQADGVNTMSMLLGYKGTFVFSMTMYFLAMIFMGYYFASNLELDRFLVFITCMLPTLFFFLWWFNAVIKNVGAANFKNTMIMNWVAAICSNAAFLIIFLMKDIF